jgi:glycosyltransferase involved in cell wall biosynthesis
VLTDEFNIYLAGDFSDHFVDQFCRAGGRIIEWKVKSKVDVLSIFNFKSIVDSLRPVACHIQDPRAGVLLRPMLKLINIPVFYTVHLPPYQYKLSGMLSAVRKKLYGSIERLMNFNFTTAIIYISHASYSYALYNGFTTKRSAHLIPNGIDLTPFCSLPFSEAQDLRRQEGISDEQVIITCIARLSGEKNHELILEAAHHLKAEGLNFVIWLVGDGPEHAKLEQRTRELGLESLVKFWGSQPNVPDYLVASDVFILTSLYEGRSFSVMEAQAAGKACILTDVGDNSEQVRHLEHGIICPPNNLNALCKGLRELITDPDLRIRLGAAGRKKALLEYDLKLSCDAHRKLLNTIFNH